jgi:hypothetical protein
MVGGRFMGGLLVKTIPMIDQLTIRLGEKMREAQGLDEEIRRQLTTEGFSIDDV